MRATKLTVLTLLVLAPSLACDGLRAPDAPIGSACRADEDCGSGYCLASGCTVSCDPVGDDCPPSWSCEPVERRDGEPVSACRCPWAGSTDECGDGADQDCDGRIDEGCGGPSKMPGTDASSWDASARDARPIDCGPRTLCGDECVDLLRDPIHCGECGNTCHRSAMCIDGACRCYGGAPLQCADQCADRIDTPPLTVSVGPFEAQLAFDTPFRSGVVQWFVDLRDPSTGEPVSGALVSLSAGQLGVLPTRSDGVEGSPAQYRGAIDLDAPGLWAVVIQVEGPASGSSEQIYLCADE